MSTSTRTFFRLLTVLAVVLAGLGFAAKIFWGLDASWLIVTALLVMIGLVLHKKLIYRPNEKRTKARALIFSALVYLAPSVACWTAVVVLITKNLLPALGGIWAQFIVLIGVFELTRLVMQKELVDLRNG